VICDLWFDDTGNSPAVRESNHKSQVTNNYLANSTSQPTNTATPIAIARA
jgi:hypothetical protein